MTINRCKKRRLSFLFLSNSKETGRNLSFYLFLFIS